jgi:phosphoglycerol transferase
LPATWVVAFSSLGGVTNLVALLTGLVVFRATTRFSVFISALVLLFLAWRLTRWSARRPRWITAGVALVATVIGLIDQLPRGPGRDWQTAIARDLEADRAFGRMLEEKLPRGSMVFQLPVIEFPEAPAPHQLEDYAYFRPYLVTQSLRFSYGALRRRCRNDWQRDLTRLAPKDLARRLERYGFAAVYFHRHAFADRGEQLLRELAAAGRTKQIIAPNDAHVAVLLQPASRPSKPTADRLTFGRGWHSARPGEPRWAYGAAAMSYYNPFSTPLRTRARFVFASEGERNLSIRVNGTEAARACVKSARQPLEFDVTLKPGVNRVDIESREPAVRSKDGNGRLRSFGVHETAMTIQIPSEAGDAETRFARTKTTD